MKKFIVCAFSILPVLTFFLISTSCQKTDHPLGLYAPNGFDIPSPTSTPLAGAINVFVVENNTAVSGVTVNLKDPNGNFLSPVVTGNGTAAYAPFSPFPVTTGTWIAEVYTQGHYIDSTQPFTVTGAQSAVTFTAGVVGTTSPSFTSGPSNQQYLTGNGSFTYGVTYTQPGNLSIPVSVARLNSLPTGFASSPSTFILGLTGTGMDQSPVTISKTACYIANVPVSFAAFDFLGNPFLSPVNFTVSRGFQVPLSVSANGSFTVVPCGGPCSTENLSYSVNLSATGDCNHSYPINIWGTATVAGGASVTWFSANPSLISGGSYSGSGSTSGSATNQILHVSVASPAGSTTGTISITSTFSGTLVNTSY